MFGLVCHNVFGTDWTGCEDEPNIVFMRKSLRTSQHGTNNVKTNNRKTQKKTKNMCNTDPHKKNMDELWCSRRVKWLRKHLRKKKKIHKCARRVPGIIRYAMCTTCSWNHQVRYVHDVFLESSGTLIIKRLESKIISKVFGSK